ncbi:hypothetical protein GCM10025868_22890 [Angustibacter aerolatus]|uniref:Glutamine amidotransferase domain-containing protein n=1 Tax=Angustibacter aerolatus TaxID=1162965 RepID=A0ABQ6JI46_9ACTN|nr:DUF881 domain-containing protein [Angustibacter aerolatus]GMA87039.1 hypothetical protein GCM10025868_22890 [Angustibacter aerolatus]
MRGPGVTVTLDDAPHDGGVPDGFTADDLLVHQQDVQAVVNTLWASGAEAMMLMDQRVVSTSAVRCVGNVLILQGRVYSPPYVVRAVGDQAAMLRGLQSAPSLQVYRQYVDAVGLGYRVAAPRSVTVPAFDGSLQPAARRGAVRGRLGVVGGHLVRVVRGAVHGIGELCITLGVVLLLFVVWQLWWTDIAAGRSSNRSVQSLEQQWQAPPKPGVTTAPVKVREPAAGRRLRADPGAAVRQGLRAPDHPGRRACRCSTAASGTTPTAPIPVRWATSPSPGTGSPTPSRSTRSPSLRDGDAVVVETARTWYVYKVYGHRVVTPDRVDVVAPVPEHPGRKPTERIMTMTACHPKYSAQERYVVWSRLDHTIDRSTGGVPDEPALGATRVPLDLAAPARPRAGAGAARRGRARGRRARALPVRLPRAGSAHALQRRDGVAVTARVLVVDNYDNFVFTIVGYLRQARRRVRGGAQRRDHARRRRRVRRGAALPGPGTPEDAGVCVDMVHACAERGQPMLGVCLGHQALGVAYGGVVDRAPEPAARQDQPGRARRRRGAARPADAVHRDPLPLADHRAGDRARRGSR